MGAILDIGGHPMKKMMETSIKLKVSVHVELLLDST
jgi:hypothetical protein